MATCAALLLMACDPARTGEETPATDADPADAAGDVTPDISSDDATPDSAPDVDTLDTTSEDDTLDTTSEDDAPDSTSEDDAADATFDSPDDAAPEPVVYVIDEDGGSVDVTMGEHVVTYTFPASAAGQEVTLTPVDDSFPGVDLDITGAIQMLPHGLEFSDPVFVTIDDPSLSLVSLNGESPDSVVLEWLNRQANRHELYHFSFLVETHSALDWAARWHQGQYGPVLTPDSERCGPEYPTLLEGGFLEVGGEICGDVHGTYCVPAGWEFVPRSDEDRWTLQVQEFEVVSIRIEPAVDPGAECVLESTRTGRARIGLYTETDGHEIVAATQSHTSIVEIPDFTEFVIDAESSSNADGSAPDRIQVCCTKQSFPFAGSECDNTNFPLGGYCSEWLEDTTVRMAFNTGSRQFQRGDYWFEVNAEFEGGERVCANAVVSLHGDDELAWTITRADYPTYDDVVVGLEDAGSDPRGPQCVYRFTTGGSYWDGAAYYGMDEASCRCWQATIFRTGGFYGWGTGDFAPCGNPDPSCSDCLLNGDETGVDCGGSECGPCAPGADCLVDSDCLRGRCVDEVCERGSPDDGS